MTISVGDEFQNECGSLSTLCVSLKEEREGERENWERRRERGREKKNKENKTFA